MKPLKKSDSGAAKNFRVFNDRLAKGVNEGSAEKLPTRIAIIGTLDQILYLSDKWEDENENGKREINGYFHVMENKDIPVAIEITKAQEDMLMKDREEMEVGDREIGKKRGDISDIPDVIPVFGHADYLDVNLNDAGKKLFPRWKKDNDELMEKLNRGGKKERRISGGCRRFDYSKNSPVMTASDDNRELHFVYSNKGTKLYPAVFVINIKGDDRGLVFTEHGIIL